MFSISKNALRTAPLLSNSSAKRVIVGLTVDRSGIPSENAIMVTETPEKAIPLAELADYEEVCRLAAEGKKPDAALERRIRARSELVRQQILRTHGVVEIGADIIRDMRDAE
jgi:hypothetical protein